MCWRNLHCEALTIYFFHLKIWKIKGQCSKFKIKEFKLKRKYQQNHHFYSKEWKFESAVTLMQEAPPISATIGWNWRPSAIFECTRNCLASSAEKAGLPLEEIFIYDPSEQTNERRSIFSTMSWACLFNLSIWSNR